MSVAGLLRSPRTAVSDGRLARRQRHTTTDGRLRRVDEDEVEKQTSALRKVLLAEMEEGMAKGLGRSSGKGLKPHQVHERAEAKIVESERLRKALGIGEGYVEGQHWGRGKDGERR